MSKSNNQHLVLEKLFNSKLRIKVLKFLFRNYPASVGVKDLARRTQEPHDLVRQEMKDLEGMGLVKRI